MAALVRFPKSVLRNLIPASGSNTRFISTSKKNRDTIATACETINTDKTATTEKKNWVSYGFDRRDETEDRNIMHNTFFFGVTLCLVFGGFVWTYLPDPHLRDWAQREAYLELRRREQLGLPLIDRNLVDPSAIELPTDEELGDMDIVI